MFKEFVVILFLGHILGDYYFQNDTLAKQKADNVARLIRHCIIYAGVCLAVILPVFSFEMAMAGIVQAASHAAVDFVKYFYCKRQKRIDRLPQNMEKRIYALDQIAHFICLGVIAYVLAANHYRPHALSFINDIFAVVQVPKKSVLSWVTLLLFIWKPANITVRQLLSFYKPEEPEDASDKKAGGLIGQLERLVILILLSIGQYPAIGLVLTAKSIARYDKISKDQGFAEYYLLGTLLSTAIVIIAYLIIV